MGRSIIKCQEPRVLTPDFLRKVSRLNSNMSNNRKVVLKKKEVNEPTENGQKVIINTSSASPSELDSTSGLKKQLLKRIKHRWKRYKIYKKMKQRGLDPTEYTEVARFTIA